MVRIRQNFADVIWIQVSKEVHKTATTDFLAVIQLTGSCFLQKQTNPHASFSSVWRQVKLSKLVGRRANGNQVKLVIGLGCWMLDAYSSYSPILRHSTYLCGDALWKMHLSEEFWERALGALLCMKFFGRELFPKRAHEFRLSSTGLLTEWRLMGWSAAT